MLLAQALCSRSTLGARRAPGCLPLRRHYPTNPSARSDSDCEKARNIGLGSRRGFASWPLLPQKFPAQLQTCPKMLHPRINSRLDRFSERGSESNLRRDCTKPPRFCHRNFSTTISREDETVHFVHATAFLPHPDKGENGEDAYFSSANSKIIGVADGVGGWVELGIDAGAFSRELMEHARMFCLESGSLDPSEILHEAYRKTTALGTCTACLVSIDGTELRAINVGDSGFSVFRRTEDGTTEHPQWALYFQTTEQTHFFNCPFQLGTNSKDSPSDGQSFTIPVEHGDLVILATDGMLDNLFTHELIQVSRFFFCFFLFFF